jgi:YjbE family integral membrane protein
MPAVTRVTASDSNQGEKVMGFSDPQFWVALGEIILVNIVLSGDNAVVIALAARSLPPKQQKMAVLGGSGAAIVLRIILTVAAVKLLTLPYLKLIGAVLLLYIGIQLLMGEDEGEDDGEPKASNLAAAIRTILIADLVMSLDNVLGVAAAAKGNTLLLIIGLAVSIPLIIFGSTIILKLMERFPVIITIGAALLGYVAGEMLVTDPSVHEWFEHHTAVEFAIPIIGAAAVVLIGRWLSSRRAAGHAHAGEGPAELTEVGGGDAHPPKGH